MSKRVNVEQFEACVHAQLEADLKDRELQVEMERLKRVLESIEKTRGRIKNLVGRGSSVHSIARLQERLEENLVEEEKIRERIQQFYVSNSGGVSRESAKSVQLSPGHAESEKGKSIPSQISSEFEEGEEEYEGEEEENEKEDVTGEAVAEHLVDDSDDSNYIKRLQSSELSNHQNTFLQPLPLQSFDNVSCVELQSRFRAPVSLHLSLFEYQKEGVEWMLKLYSQRAGGILGDEMGLGKTTQVIAAIATLQCSELLVSPVLIVCPTTLIKQWLDEMNKWWPGLRTLVLHSALNPSQPPISIVRKAFTYGHVVLTSYGHLQLHSDLLVKECKWRAVFLDEGHKIRNPHAAITVLCKQFRTTHRYILSGTPIQNNLIELWSLIDFCFPGKLGTLSVFRNEFAVPIATGNYLKASSFQVQRAISSACALRDLIEPYLLRRLKADVATQLPPKREQILFCRLTDYQRRLYEAFLESDEVHSILLGKRNALYGIDVMRKICNHPDLLSEAPWNTGVLEIGSNSNRKGSDAKSGKLMELLAILSEWHAGGHRVLLFCQTRQMLDIVEESIKQNFSFRTLRMDGSTAAQQRALLVHRFNASNDIFLFFLTTRVGGLGVNLTAADRVLIFDPDWNPSTDQQARERSWRLGQDRPVCIYRLVCEGTVEEKILHRQVFKTFLTHRILKDPKQTRFFKHSDLHDLFTLGGNGYASAVNANTAADGGSAGSEDRVFDGPNTETGLDEAPRTKRLMADIIEISGLQGALEHSRSLRQLESVESRSQQIVSDSVAALHQSGRQMRAEMGMATGVDPEELLCAIQNIASVADPKVVQLARQLIAFIGQDGTASSDDIFKRFQPADRYDALVLRQTLKAVAVLDKSSHSWALKPQFI